MNVAFVGVKRKYLELQLEYRRFFTQFHLELPWYFAAHGNMEVTVTTVDHSDYEDSLDTGGMFLFYVEEKDFGVPYDIGGLRPDYKYDVVVHWRKWFPEFYRPEAINVINCQDHSFSDEWKSEVCRAWDAGQLHGILCFPTWHERHIKEQFRQYGIGVTPRTISGLTLGVDTEIYKPMEGKDPYQMLWASDPGRGLSQAIQLAILLFQKDRRYRLHVCYPDYCRGVQRVNHPAIVWHGNVNNGPHLWRLFDECGTLPYTSTFMEPSSRAHRQAMAAGSLVLYPPGRGSPSELIEHMKTGVVSDPATWSKTIDELVKDGRWLEIGENARQYAISESWEVQAGRFREYFEKVLGEKNVD